MCSMCVYLWGIAVGLCHSQQDAHEFCRMYVMIRDVNQVLQ